MAERSLWYHARSSSESCWNCVLSCSRKAIHREKSYLWRFATKSPKRDSWGSCWLPGAASHCALPEPDAGEAMHCRSWAWGTHRRRLVSWHTKIRKQTLSYFNVSPAPSINKSEHPASWQRKQIYKRPRFIILEQAKRVNSTGQFRLASPNLSLWLQWFEWP